MGTTGTKSETSDHNYRDVLSEGQTFDVPGLARQVFVTLAWSPRRCVQRRRVGQQYNHCFLKPYF